MFPLTPALSLKGEGAVRADIILWGTLTLVGEGWGEGNSPHNTPSFPTLIQRIIPLLLSIFSSEAL